MTLHEPAERPAASASAASPVPTTSIPAAPAVALPTSSGRSTSPLAALRAFVVKTLNIAEWEARKLAHDPTDLITRSVQPLLWLLVFGQVLARTRAIGTGSVPYQDFLAPGILAQSVLFLSIFYGIAVIWERDLGVIHKFLASPTPRGALVLGKALSASVRALPQAAVIYVVSLFLGVGMSWNPLALLGVILMVVLGAACFSTFSVIIACSLRSRERVMGIGQVLTMPLFFASNAIYPINLMPGWLVVIARLNPLSYMVDGLRALMLTSYTSVLGLDVDFAVMLGVTAALVLLAARLYPRLIQ